MKYLKLFLESQENVYQEVEFGYWRDHLDSALIPQSCTKQDIKQIADIMNRNSVDVISIEFFKSMFHYGDIHEIATICARTANDKYSIYKYSDEWYVIFTDSNMRCFKCDQLEGVEELIKVRK